MTERKIDTIKAILIFSAILFFLLTGFMIACKSPAPSKNKTSPRGDLVDCNYYWPMRKRYVCIKDMPIFECEALFQDSRMGFNREKSCVCDEKGRRKNSITGTGYVQYDCD